MFRRSGKHARRCVPPVRERRQQLTRDWPWAGVAQLDGEHELAERAFLRGRDLCRQSVGAEARDPESVRISHGGSKGCVEATDEGRGSGQRFAGGIEQSHRRPASVIECEPDILRGKRRPG